MSAQKTVTFQYGFHFADTEIEAFIGELFTGVKVVIAKMKFFVIAKMYYL